MPDFKLWKIEPCRRYLLAPDYSVAARAVVKAMRHQVGELKVDEQGLALRGVLVRHLVMPGLVEETKHIMDFLSTEVSQDTYVSIMDQYRPEWKVKSTNRYSPIARPTRPEELRQAYRCARKAGLWRFDTRLTQPAFLLPLEM